jgi:hypothetical protein
VASKAERTVNRKRGFDEVMIVNPDDPNFGPVRGVRLMTFGAGDPSMGYYAEPPEPYLSYGDVDPYGVYGEPVVLDGWGEPYEPVGYFADEYPFGYYGEEYPPAGYGQPYYLGGYGQEYPLAGYGEPYPFAGYGQPYPFAGYGQDYPAGYAEDPTLPGYYGQVPEMVGYGQYEPLAEEYPFAGYVREAESSFNAGCPMPTNVAGLDEVEPLEGYVRPRAVSPSCETFSPAPSVGPSSEPETFKPLW